MKTNNKNTMIRLGKGAERVTFASLATGFVESWDSEKETIVTMTLDMARDQVAALVADGWMLMGTQRGPLNHLMCKVVYPDESR